MQRYIALDALRGLTIALMILVNSPGSWAHIYAPFQHSHWHGLTPTDLVFPFFLFVVGSAMYFSFKKTNFTLDKHQAYKIFKRGALIFFIGVLLNIYPSFPSIDELRIFGPLQRIAICYVIAALLVTTLNKESLIAFSVVMLLGYMVILILGGNEQPFSVDGNVIRVVDLWLVGESHMWNFQNTAFDPEGVLSSLVATVNVIWGFLITRYISKHNDQSKTIAGLIKIGLLVIAAGCIWHYVMPINKALWTSSYVLVSSGAACVVLALFIYIVDIKKNKSAVTPLLVYGTNPLFIYVFSWLWFESYVLVNVGDITLYQWIFDALCSGMAPKFASLLFAFVHVVLFWFISNVLYQKKIFIKL